MRSIGGEIGGSKKNFNALHYLAEGLASNHPGKGETCQLNLEASDLYWIGRGLQTGRFITTLIGRGVCSRRK